MNLLNLLGVGHTAYHQAKKILDSDNEDKAKKEVENHLTKILLAEKKCVCYSTLYK